MGTLMDKLNATNASKEQIRQAIERKKVSVPPETPLKDYPAKIDGIYPDALFERMVSLPPLSERTDEIIVSAYCNGIYLVLDYSTGYVCKEGDVSWKKVTRPKYGNHIVGYNGNFVAVGADASAKKFRIMTSKDGIDWSAPIDLSHYLNTYSSYTYHFVDNNEGVLYLFVCNYDGRHSYIQTSIFFTTTDCINWTYQGKPFNDEFNLSHKNALTYDKKTQAFYVCKNHPTHNEYYLYKSVDGKSRTSIQRLYFPNSNPNNYDVLKVQSNGVGQILMSRLSYESEANYSGVYFIDVSQDVPRIIGDRLNQRLGVSGEIFLLSEGLFFCSLANIYHDVRGYIGPIEGRVAIALNSDSPNIIFVPIDLNYNAGNTTVGRTVHCNVLNGLIIADFETGSVGSEQYHIEYLSSAISKGNTSAAYSIKNQQGQNVTNSLMLKLFNNKELSLVNRNVMQSAYQAGVNSI